MGFTEEKSDVDGGSGTGVSSQRKSHALIRRVIEVQVVATALVSISLLLLSWVAAYSALLGGLICVIPNGYLAWRITRSADLTPHQRTGRLIQGEAGKLIQTALLFALVFALVKPLDPILLLTTFIGVQLLHWLTPVVANYISNS